MIIDINDVWRVTAETSMKDNVVIKPILNHK